MRRLLHALAIAFAVVTAALVLRGGPDAQAGSSYRVDAIFDTAKGIIPGQLVKIAGARVGAVDDVVLTPDYKARIEMSVDARFAPFHSDASCDIQPEGLISENFVQCDPGTTGTLAPSGGHPPTVGVDHTAAPVNLTDLFQIWQAPVRDRLPLIFSALGIGLSGRGDDVNETLRRVNPALGSVRKLLGVLNGQRALLGDAIESTDRAIASLPRHRRQLAATIATSARVTGQVARHSDSLAEGIRRLPGLLSAARPALTKLDAVAASGTPILEDLRGAAPELSRLVGQVPAFSAATRPAIRHLGPAATTGIRTAKDASPVVANLARFANLAGPIGTMTNDLVTSLRDQGAIENLLTFVYEGAAAGARYDSKSHIIPAHLLLSNCMIAVHVPATECSANYTATGAKRSARTARRTTARDTAGTPAAGSPVQKPEALALPTQLEQLVRRLSADPGPQQLLRGLADYLLK